MRTLVPLRTRFRAQPLSPSLQRTTWSPAYAGLIFFFLNATAAVPHRDEHHD